MLQKGNAYSLDYSTTLGQIAFLYDCLPKLFCECRIEAFKVK